MNDVCIVVADGARARIFALDDRDDGTGSLIRCLVEIEDLINPIQRLHDADIYSHSRPGLTREFAGGVGAAHDEHRDDHATEVDRRFAGEIIAAAIRVMADRGTSRLLLVAAPHMLGHLRERGRRLPAGTRVQELAKHLTQLAPAELLAALELTDLSLRFPAVP